MPPPSSRSRQGFNAPRSSSRRAPPRDNSRDDNRSGMQSINHHPNDDLPPINQVEQPASKYNSRQQQDQIRTINSLAAKTEEDCVFHAIFQCLCNGELRPLTDDPKKMMTTLMVRIIQALVSCVLADLSVPQPVDCDDNETPFDAMMSSICSNFKEFVEFASYISVTLPKRGPLSAAYISYITNELGLPKPRNAMVDMPLFHVEIANIKKSINAICAISDPASTAAESGMQTKQRSFADISSEILKLILICPQFVDLSSLEKPDDDVALVVKYTRRIRELSEQTADAAPMSPASSLEDTTVDINLGTLAAPAVSVASAPAASTETQPDPTSDTQEMQVDQPQTETTGVPTTLPALAIAEMTPLLAEETAAATLLQLAPPPTELPARLRLLPTALSGVSSHSMKFKNNEVKIAFSLTAFVVTLMPGGKETQEIVVPATDVATVIRNLARLTASASAETIATAMAQQNHLYSSVMALLSLLAQIAGERQAVVFDPRLEFTPYSQINYLAIVLNATIGITREELETVVRVVQQLAAALLQSSRVFDLTVIGDKNIIERQINIQGIPAGDRVHSAVHAWFAAVAFFVRMQTFVPLLPHLSGTLKPPEADDCIELLALLKTGSRCLVSPGQHDAFALADDPRVTEATIYTAYYGDTEYPLLDMLFASALFVSPPLLLLSRALIPTHTHVYMLPTHVSVDDVIRLDIQAMRVDPVNCAAVFMAYLAIVSARLHKAWPGAWLPTQLQSFPGEDDFRNIVGGIKTLWEQGLPISTELQFSLTPAGVRECINYPFIGVEHAINAIYEILKPGVMLTSWQKTLDLIATGGTDPGYRRVFKRAAAADIHDGAKSIRSARTTKSRKRTRVQVADDNDDDDDEAAPPQQPKKRARKAVSSAKTPAPPLTAAAAAAAAPAPPQPAPRLSDEDMMRIAAMVMQMQAAAANPPPTL